VIFFSLSSPTKMMKDLSANKGFEGLLAPSYS
jgi:hypothetical protein